MRPVMRTTATVAATMVPAVVSTVAPTLAASVVPTMVAVAPTLVASVVPAMVAVVPALVASVVSAVVTTLVASVVPTIVRPMIAIVFGSVARAFTVIVTRVVIAALIGRSFITATNFDVRLDLRIDLDVMIVVLTVVDVDVTAGVDSVVVATDIVRTARGCTVGKRPIGIPVAITGKLRIAPLHAAVSAASPAGGLALLADLLDAAGQVAARRGQNREDCLESLKRVGECLHDRLDPTNPLGDPAGDLFRSNRSRRAQREDNLSNHFEARHDNVRDRAHDRVVNVIDRIGNLRQRRTKCA